MRIGLIGCGTIGQFLIEHFNDEKNDSPVRIHALLDERSKDLQRYQIYQDTKGIELCSDFDEFINLNIDVIVETATIAAVKMYAEKILKSGKSFLPISVGAFGDLTYVEKLRKLAFQNQTKIFIPSGAIAGLDAIQAGVSNGALESVSLVTTKPADSLNQEKLKSAKVLYAGNALEAVQQFPSNMNVAIVLSLAGIGPEATTVTIIADPEVKENRHEVTAQGAFGKLTIRLDNEPLPSNPKTSYLAALSVISVLQKIANPVQIM